MYIAHIREKDNAEQPLIDHLREVEKLCREFADEFDNGDFAAYCGRLHDIGKYSDEFQKRIRRLGPKCDHSTAGAKIIIADKPFGKIAAYCIAGHHTGLLNIGSSADCEQEGTLRSRLSTENIKRLPKYDNYKAEITLPAKILPNRKMFERMSSGKNSGFAFSFFTRMIFSCLTDADYMDTVKFMNPALQRKRDNTDFNLLLTKLNTALDKFSDKAGLVNIKRSEILKCCIRSASSVRGLFTLTVPTGGGKTLSSMAFALNHLLHNNMKRIIYVIPYTSIIEQNAEVFKGIFGNELVLEHHSSYDFDNPEDPANDNKRLAAENWDMPIIVTTNVQFFESLFSNKSSRCRKLHNIANSVIILDEAQMLPLNYLKPCTAAIAELVKNYKCTAVLCSATQPALRSFFSSDINIKEICPNTKELFDVFKRTDIKYRIGLTKESLVAETNELNQCLIIVNTRRHAKELFSLLKGEGVFHLSTLMCPAHRKAVISEIKRRLENHFPCRVISTQLIEAGVDVDFPVVYREMCGLDSLLQAAGRCNREGKLTDSNGNKVKGMVYCFSIENEKTPPQFRTPISLMNEIGRHFSDIGSPEAIEDYFNKLYYYLGDELDRNGIMRDLNNGFPKNPYSFDECFNYDFKTIAESFKLIDDNSCSVIIPFNADAKRKAEQLRRDDGLMDTMRSLQQYTVNIFPSEFERLIKTNKLDAISENTAILKSLDDYDMDIGIGVE